MYRDISTEDMIFATPTLKESELYLMQQKGNTKQTKQGLSVDAEVRAKNVGEDVKVIQTFKKMNRDVAQATEMLSQAYSLVKYGWADMPATIKSGRSEFFNATDSQAQSMIALAYKKAKRLDYNALAIAKFAMDYILKNKGKIPKNMRRNFGYVALKVYEEGL
tara:strand:- start:71 stop:559 length:489 start_codon:yes stop_codon:yes gene_type:complete